MDSKHIAGPGVQQHPSGRASRVEILALNLHQIHASVPSGHSVSSQISRTCGRPAQMFHSIPNPWQWRSCTNHHDSIPPYHLSNSSPPHPLPRSISPHHQKTPKPAETGPSFHPHSFPWFLSVYTATDVPRTFHPPLRCPAFKALAKSAPKSGSGRISGA